MGRIKSTLIKRTAKQLAVQNSEFTSEFERNKGILRQTMPSKHVANKIAGYIARLVQQRESESSKKEIAKEIKEDEE